MSGVDLNINLTGLVYNCSYRPCHNLKGRGHMKDLSLDGLIILSLILKE
jgi:hypothetical protein